MDAYSFPNGSQGAFSRKPEEVIKRELDTVKETNQLLPDLVFRSSYFLDMLGLPDAFSERDLEDAILSQIQLFIKELGSDFAFLDRQKRITVDAVDYYIDLLFFHRGLRRMVAIDLKRTAGDNPTIGLILCTETSKTSQNTPSCMEIHSSLLRST